MKVGDLVKLYIDKEFTQFEMFSSSSAPQFEMFSSSSARELGIIIESHNYNKKSSGNEYNYFVVHWLETNMRSTHSASGLALIVKEKNENW